jgi:hypothetical protein
LSGSGCPWIDEGQEEASTEVPKQHRVAITVLRRKNIVIVSIEKNKTK